MSEKETKVTTASGSQPPADQVYGWVELRLSLRDWIVAGAIVVAALALVPTLGRQVEPFAPGEDYRIPHKLSEDYWTFQRFSSLQAGQDKTLVIGDSVVWGEYVTSRQTLSHHLSALAGGGRFANLGVPGMYPAAMAGLLEHYGGGIANRRVLLHCNMLWLASKEHDLQEGKEFRLNHPGLIPQFFPRIPVHTASRSDRLGNVMRHVVPFRAWVWHWRTVCLDGADLPNWTIDHPYGNPAVLPGDDTSGEDDPASSKPVSWRKAGKVRQDYPWVDLSDSIQWQLFQRCVETLQRRGNQVFVLVGPFNEDMLLSPQTRQTYALRKAQIEAWLREKGIACSAPGALRSDLYADASHLLDEGYAELAALLLGDESFAAFCGAPRLAPLKR
jgi:hypothetical protein